MDKTQKKGLRFQGMLSIIQLSEAFGILLNKTVAR